MLFNPTNPVESATARGLRRWLRPFIAFAHRCPFITYVILGILVNLGGTFYNLGYNWFLVEDSLDPGQRAAFLHVMVPLNNSLTWTIGLVLVFKPLLPLVSCRRDLQAGREVEPARLLRCQRLMINLPWYQVKVVFWFWMAGGIVFPVGICLLAGWHNAEIIWVHFFISFFVSALVSMTQTYFVLETFLIKVLYPVFFRDARPTEIPGARLIPLKWKLVIYNLAVGVVPIIAVLMVALYAAPHLIVYQIAALLVALGGIGCSALVSWIMGKKLLDWVRNHIEITRQIRAGNYKVRIHGKSPDEFGQLDDKTDDMAAGLDRAEEVRETFGEFVGSEVAEEILCRYKGLVGQVEEITIFFADIRGFTRRSAGEPPEQVFELLNRFMGLAVAAIVEQEGWVNKFLGDGLMALFGFPKSRSDHADLAVQAAVTLVARLDGLNRELAKQDQPPLAVGIGIHTGPALVGSVGAALSQADGKTRKRRELTAIGETVNMCSRIEQLTKKVGGPIVISEATRSRLQRPLPLTCLGPQSVPGFDGTLVVHRVDRG